MKKSRFIAIARPVATAEEVGLTLICVSCSCLQPLAKLAYMQSCCCLPQALHPPPPTHPLSQSAPDLLFFFVLFFHAAMQAMQWVQAKADPSATHNCYAYKIAEAHRSSDDGEPSGTAGRPLLTAIEGEGLDGVVVLVIRCVIVCLGLSF